MSTPKNKQTPAPKKDIDQLSGVETTGHEWDGLKELNNPLPRWWVWVWLVCILYSVWYVVAYPMWPTVHGTKGYSEYAELAQSQKEIINRQKAYLDRFKEASLQDIMKDPELYAFALAGGKAAFKENCATCHGTGAEGNIGYPNLNDDDWLWGGTLEAIHTTITGGIRDTLHSDNPRMSQMPAFGKDNILPREDISLLADFVLNLHKNGMDKKSKAYTLFQENCASCHGATGHGGRDVGAPNLADNIWLYGGTREAVFQSIYTPHAGMMPSWKKRLDKNTIKQLTIYVHQLGGGEADTE